jgi:ABC-type multidrug transport system fused ATPase/permease subunit
MIVESRCAITSVVRPLRISPSASCTCRSDSESSAAVGSRFYTVHGGRILIDGQDIATLSRGSLRQQIAYVGQLVHLFRGSIRDNIALGRLGASEAEIVAAAKAAHAHDFSTSFPRAR